MAVPQGDFHGRLSRGVCCYRGRIPGVGAELVRDSSGEGVPIAHEVFPGNISESARRVNPCPPPLSRPYSLGPVPVGHISSPSLRHKVFPGASRNHFAGSFLTHVSAALTPRTSRNQAPDPDKVHPSSVSNRSLPLDAFPLLPPLPDAPSSYRSGRRASSRAGGAGSRGNGPPHSPPHCTPTSGTGSRSAVTSLAPA